MIEKILMYKKILFIAGLSFLFAFEQELIPVQKSFITFVGVKFNLVQNGNAPKRYLWIHGDEKTAKMALENHIKNYQGTAFFIQNEEREIPFENTIIDPNRVFSRNGAYYALRKFQPGWPPGSLKKALDQIDKDRKIFLNILMPSKDGLLIAVHNNFRGYNVRDEEPKSQRTSIKKEQNPRDFILCTNEDDFEKLSLGPFNVVLQNELPLSDDGSLSWEALRRNVRYLNVETRLGYLSQQKKMLKFIEKALE